MSRPFRVTIVQFDQDSDDPHENLAALMEYVKSHRRSDLIVFPELALHGHEITYDHERQMRSALRAVTRAELDAFDAHIRKEEAKVVYGELVGEEGKLYNMATYTDGHERVSYAKTHVHWSEPFEPGHEFPVVHSHPHAPLGMLICFDAAFPEVPRLLAINGAKIIVNISAIPEHFPLKYVHRRLVGCSMENQVFTIFANRRGDGFLGGSAIVDPRGEMVALADDKQPILEATIDLMAIDEWRQEEPLFPNRKPALYGDITRT